MLLVSRIFVVYVRDSIENGTVKKFGRIQIVWAHRDERFLNSHIIKELYGICICFISQFIILIHELEIILYNLSTFYMNLNAGFSKLKFSQLWIFVESFTLTTKVKV